MPLTAATITDEQIKALRDGPDATRELKSKCNLALLAPGGVGIKHEYAAARACCADVYNSYVGKHCLIASRGCVMWGFGGSKDCECGCVICMARLLIR